MIVVDVTLSDSVAIARKLQVLTLSALKRLRFQS